MPQLPPNISLPDALDVYTSKLAVALQNFNRKLVDIINKGIRIEDNLNVQEKAYTTNGTPNTEDSVSHTLKRIPRGYFLVGSDKAVSLYNGTTSWTATALYIKANVASAAITIIIY